MLFVLILSNRAASYGAIMAALPYMQLYIADYLADTMHLSAEEHGAYLLLMFNYWQTGKPIPKNRLAKIARLTNERWVDVEPSLREFFCDNGDEWMHLRIEEDLASVSGFAPIFPDICYHLTHYKPAAADIPVASDNPAHYADAIRYNARTPLQGSLLPLTRLVWA